MPYFTTSAWHQWTLKHCRFIIYASLLVSAVCAYGLSFFELSADAWIYFDKNNPQLIAFHELEDKYTKSENIFIVLQPANKNVFTQQTLALVLDITDQAWQIPYTQRVDSLTNFQHISALQDEVFVGDLVESVESLTSIDLESIKKIALNEVGLVDRIVSKDGSTTGIYLTLHFPEGNHTQHINQSVEAVQALVQRLTQTYPDYRIALTGLAMMSYTEAWATAMDMSTLLPLMYVFIVITLAVLLRSFYATIITLIIVTLSAIIATGLVSWWGIKLNSSSMAAPVIILTLAIADCVHIFTTMFAYMAAGSDKKQALLSSLNDNTQAIFLTSLTTSIGFLSLNFSDSPPFRDLGNTTAIGVFAAWLLAMFLLPAIVSLLPFKPNTHTNTLLEPVKYFGNYIVKYRKGVFGFISIISLLIISFIPRLNIDDRFVEFFDPDIPFRVDTDFVMANLTGIYSLEFSIDSGQSGAIASPDYLTHLDKFAKWLRQQPDVRQISTFCDVMKRLNQAMHGDNPDYYRVPQTRELAAQYLLLYEMSLPYGLDLNSQITVDKSATRVIVVLNNLPTRALRDIAVAAQLWLASNTPPSMHATASGSSILFAHLTERNIRTMLRGTVLAFILIAIVLMLMLRNIKLGLISLIPNLIPVLLTFGVWALFRDEIGIVASVIAATSMGLIVDDTVHILCKYNHARAHLQLEPAEAISFTFSHVGQALLITTIVLVIGFSILGFSNFQIDSDFGLLTAMTMVFAIIMDFFYLPPLLLYSDKKHY